LSPRRKCFGVRLRHSRPLLCERRLLCRIATQAGAARRIESTDGNRQRRRPQELIDADTSRLRPRIERPNDTGVDAERCSSQAILPRRGLRQREKSEGSGSLGLPYGDGHSLIPPARKLEFFLPQTQLQGCEAALKLRIFRATEHIVTRSSARVTWQRKQGDGR